jgi:hypothetical protein
MISLDYAKPSDRLVRATTSLTVSEFEELARRFGGAWTTMRASKTAAGAARKRRPGGGREGCLVGAEQKLFFILLYFKAYPTQGVMGLLFGITLAQVSEWVRVLMTVVGQLIPLHRPTRWARDLTQLLRDQPELKGVIIDGTEFVFVVVAYVALAGAVFLAVMRSRTAPVSNSYVNNLRELGRAKASWRLENHKTTSEASAWSEPLPYLRQKPVCPQGGPYILGQVGEPPKCSLGGTHRLPQ